MTLADDLAAAVSSGMPRLRDELTQLVACRSVYNPDIEPLSECTKAAKLAAELFRDAGIDVTLEETLDGSLAVVGRELGPMGAPAVLLYTHHDVVPAGEQGDWNTPPFELTEHDGRWYGRGAADCKGNLAATLLALRSLTTVLGKWPVTVAVVCEGSEEQSSGGMEGLARSRPDLVAADAIVLADTGNVAAGHPTLTTSLRGTGSVIVTVTTMAGPAHSGSYGGAAPDALQSLLTALTSLRSATGETTIDGLDHSGTWDGAPFDPTRFAADAAIAAGVAPLLGDLAAHVDSLPGGDLGNPPESEPGGHVSAPGDPGPGTEVSAPGDSGPRIDLGSHVSWDPGDLPPEQPAVFTSPSLVRPEGTSAPENASADARSVAEGQAIADLLWARPAATVLAIDCPPIGRVTAAIQGQARAVVNLRVPPHLDAAAAQQLLIAHLKNHTPYGLVQVKPVSLGQGFRARTEGPAYAAMGRAMARAFGRGVVTTGQGGSIPLAVALAEVHPDAEILLLGVEEPASRIHGPNESVSPAELERTALAIALFLCGLAGVPTE